MDKNLRAELSALKSDVTAQLSGLQELIKKIDGKMSMFDTEDGSEVGMQFEPEVSERHLSPDADVNEITRRFMEVSHWDEHEYELFVDEWNATRKRRIESLEVVLATLIADIQRHMPDPIMVKTSKDASLALDAMNTLEEAKDDIITTIRAGDRAILQTIIDEERPDNFVIYYQWINDIISVINAIKLRVDPPADSDMHLADAIEAAKTQVDYQAARMAGFMLDLFVLLLDQHELEMYDLKVVDPQTFEAKETPADKLKHYRQWRLGKYKSDLQHAYEYIAKRDGRVVQCLSGEVDKTTYVVDVGNMPPKEAMEAVEQAIAVVKASNKTPLVIDKQLAADLSMAVKEGKVDSDMRDNLRKLREIEAAYKADLAAEKEREEMLRLSRLVQAGAEALGATPTV